MTDTPSRRMTSIATLTLFSLSLAMILPGCGGGASGPEGQPRVHASGKVEVDGQPVAAGTVSFLHADTGHTAICQIDGGEYECSSGDGPNPGNNLVMVEAKESAEGNPLWSQPWRKNVQVGDTDFAEDFSISSSEMQPFDPASRMAEDGL